MEKQNCPACPGWENYSGERCPHCGGPTAEEPAGEDCPGIREVFCMKCGTVLGYEMDEEEEEEEE
jgi:hypothetical protein